MTSPNPTPVTPVTPTPSVQDDELQDGAQVATTAKKGCLSSRRAKVILLVLILISLCTCCLGLLVARIFFTGENALMAPGSQIPTAVDAPVYWGQQMQCVPEGAGGFKFEQPRIEVVEGKSVMVVFVYGRPVLPTPEEYAEDQSFYLVDFGGTSVIYPTSVKILDTSNGCTAARLEFEPIQGGNGLLKIWGVVAQDTAFNSTQIKFP